MPIHPTACIDHAAQVDPTTTIGPHTVITGHVVIGPNCQIGPSTTILGQTTIGSGCQIYPHAVIGDTPQDYKYRGEPTYCRIGDDCVIREGVTIHRATLNGQATVVGDRCYLMTNSHVAHDCVLNDEVTLSNGALLGGHVQVGSRATISQHAGIHQFVRIGELALIESVTMIAQDVPPYLMTDREGRLSGVNAIGLCSAGIRIEVTHEISTLFQTIYRSTMPLHKALEFARDISVSVYGQRFLDFFDSGTTRGFRKETER